MRLHDIRFDEDANPAEIGVVMTRDEMVALAHFASHTSPACADAAFPRGEEALNGVYECLIGDVINRFWYEGLSGLETQHTGQWTFGKPVQEDE